MKAFINTSFNYMTIKPLAGNDNNQRTTEKNKYIISFSSRLKQFLILLSRVDLNKHI